MLDAHRKSNTRRRAEMAANIIHRAQAELQRADVALRIADGDGGATLERVKTLATIATLEAALANGRSRAATPLGRPFDRVDDDGAIKFARMPTGDEDAMKRLRAAGISDNEGLRAAIRSMLELRGPRREEDPVKALERKLVGLSIPSFFPTPRDLAARMVALAEVKPGQSVLEPSAGSGHIADEIRAVGGVARCVEVNSTLCELLRVKGHLVHRGDFLEFTRGDLCVDGEFDAAVANYPFEAGADIDHLLKTERLIVPGGMLVAIVGAGTKFRADRRYVSFREWLATQDVVHDEDLPAGTFNHSDMTQRTNVAARLIALRVRVR